MIDRSKPLYEQPANEVRALLDALHGNRERYDRANRIVEVRSCELEIAEATRALAIINRRATEAGDQRAAEERESVRGFVKRVVTARVACVAGWNGFEPGSIERMTADIADRVAEGLGAPAPLAQQTLTEERAREVMERVLIEEWKRPPAGADPAFTFIRQSATRAAKEMAGAVVSAEHRDRIVTIADEAFGLGPVEPLDATLTRIERGLHEQHKRLLNLQTQCEADLREAFIAGSCWFKDRWPDDDRDPRPAAAEYARSKAGG